MRTVLASTLCLALLTTSGLAQSYTAPAPTDVPSSGTKSLNKADRKIACTQEADRRNMRGLSRQQYRAACRNRPIPRG
ncbi:hypothetical protein MKK70_25135 [Methylobacterium sp. E-041]|jgi:hypothetical protein|uniref:hypothetical protein n=1 Tax=unclassified Methylobacterium TaxID=2615210 RepID=UPI0011C868AB|nr:MULTISPECIES: hypothetical protein [unclassified Methylobacterium]RZM05027.1 MAG: hypothetical protein EOP68_19025 [Sphingomonas sp.]MCJ2010342.1 hypothetical protein [Methylobacterium sp. J-092]MCJ2042451.1 hypothetical protein [Methylobacterium sp. J-059]MCJ2077358.1 hypothetical protein [Methylobacterium sp. E-016]MCJ2108596.1 hypothetical protein [Methylobacterium sp. E-041]